PEFKKTRTWFTEVGIEYHLVLPLRFFGSRYTRFDLRNHRKIVVIDGQVGFTGSQNMIKRNYFRKDSIYYDELVAKVTVPIAAQRGVDIKLINSEVSDQFLVGNAERSYYEDLLHAGVKIYQYNAPILLHSKTMSIDDDMAVIGSSNLDMRSFHLNLEVTLI